MTAVSLGKTVIIGLGKTGFSCAKFLSAQGVVVSVTDTRAIPPYLQQLRDHLPHVPVAVGGLQAEMIAAADTLVVSPGVALTTPVIQTASQRGATIIGDIELFARHANAPIVAITGSNGKSTVTTLVGEMAKQAGLTVQVGGNLGEPALDLLRSPAPDLYVIELSSFQLETTQHLQATAATILNISPDHLDRYATMQEYIRAKQRILTQSAHWVINADDPVTMQGLSIKPDSLYFSVEKPADFYWQADALYYRTQRLIATRDIKLTGLHQYANILAALALGMVVNIPLTAMVETLKTFAGLAHRCQIVADKNDVLWINDSKGTNVGATVAAIQGLGASHGKHLILIAGGLGKNADFSLLRAPVAQYVKDVILIGQDAPLIKKQLHDIVPLHPAQHMFDAVTQAAHIAKSGDVILLSPACASFDMFTGFEQRGEVFSQAVRNLIA